MNHNLIALFTRDLKQVSKEVSAFAKAEDLWFVKGNVSNSAGNLVLHICGNLRHFIGAVISNDGYVRERDREFSDRDIPREELLKLIEKTIETVESGLSKVTLEQWDETYPLPFREENVTYGFFMLHLYGHLGYHLGQINYLRRLI